MVIILDCNIWVTLTLNGEIELLADLSDDGHVLPTCIELRGEITNVLKRPKFAKLISASTVDKVTQLHDLITKAYKPGEILPIAGDPKDDYLFALASKCKADYLVTGDKVLLNIGKHKTTQIINLSRLRELRKGL